VNKCPSNTQNNNGNALKKTQAMTLATKTQPSDFNVTWWQSKHMAMVWTVDETASQLHQVCRLY